MARNRKQNETIIVDDESLKIFDNYKILLSNLYNAIRDKNLNDFDENDIYNLEKLSDHLYGTSYNLLESAVEAYRNDTNRYG